MGLNTIPDMSGDRSHPALKRWAISKRPSGTRLCKLSRRNSALARYSDLLHCVSGLVGALLDSVTNCLCAFRGALGSVFGSDLGSVGRIFGGDFRSVSGVFGSDLGGMASIFGGVLSFGRSILRIHES